MTKKIFLVFTLFMVIITGTLFYGIITKARNEQERRLSTIKAKLSEPDSSSVITPLPLPRAFHTDQGNLEESQEKPESLTKGQRYYTSLSDQDSKNVLLIGKDPAYSNFDTLVVVSVNEKNETIRLIDLPRDIYIDYSDAILEKLHDTAYEFFNEKGSRKLNAAHVVGRKIKYAPENERFSGKQDINFITDLIQEIFNIKVDDYIAIETDGFREMVDYFGGVVVNVPYAMHYDDPTQDLYIHLEPGLQVLNGTQAEGFVRFRQGYNESGQLVSYSRADNTFLFLKSFFKQHATLRNLGKTGKVYEIFKNNANTSIESIGDAYQYSRLLKRILENEYSIESVTIECTGSRMVNDALYELIRTK
ncbi:MAG: LCP family protein [Clostridiaceae bacterium]|jgi:LCP family protein required for cell wall assembly|nr:LCP family protein [Clostridiaceae bacterium]